MSLIESDLLDLACIELNNWQSLFACVEDDRVALRLAVLSKMMLPVQEVRLLTPYFLGLFLLLLQHVAPNADHLALLS